jgi:hypothetical protein
LAREHTAAANGQSRICFCFTYNHCVISKLFKLAIFVGACVIVVWLTRERLLPAPHVPHEPPPRFRSTPPQPEQRADDLTQIKGIGPVYSARLKSIGITTFEGLAEIDPEVAADAAGVSTSAVEVWAAQARHQAQ